MRIPAVLALLIFLSTSVFAFAQILSEQTSDDPQDRCIRIYGEALKNKVVTEGYGRVLEDLVYAEKEGRADDVRRNLRQLKEMTTDSRRQRNDLQDCARLTERYLLQIERSGPLNIGSAIEVLGEQSRIYRVLSARLIELPDAQAKVVKALEKKYKPK